MVQTMANVAEALKSFYLPGIQYQLNVSNPVLAMIERDSTSVSGSDIVMALRYGRSGGVGNRADDGNLPTPNARKTKQAKWETKNIFARLQITDKTMKASRSKMGAFLSLLEADLEDTQADAKDDLARQVYGDGTGLLTKVRTAAANVATVDVNSVQYLVEGKLIDVYAAGGAVIATGLEVLVVDDTDESLPKITLSAPITAAVGDEFYIAGNKGIELTGFSAVFTPDNTLYNIDRAQNKWFNPTVKTLGGEISEVAIQKMIDDTDRKSGSKVNFLNSSYGVRRAYQELQLANKRITETMELIGGFDAISYNHIPFTVDKYAPNGTLLGLDLSTWCLYHIEDWNWLDEDGGIIVRVPGKPIWEATLVRYCDIGCNKPKGNFKMSQITEH